MVQIQWNLEVLENGNHAGLPDFSGCKLPKRGKNAPKDLKIFLKYN
jgi:hypothetical protein